MSFFLLRVRLSVVAQLHRPDRGRPSRGGRGNNGDDAAPGISHAAETAQLVLEATNERAVADA